MVGRTGLAMSPLCFPSNFTCGLCTFAKIFEKFKFPYCPYHNTGSFLGQFVDFICLGGNSGYGGFWGHRIRIRPQY